MINNNYELLGYLSSVSADRLAKAAEDMYYGLDNYSPEANQVAVRSSDIKCVSNAIVLFHLGFPLLKQVDVYLQQGFDVVVNYFCNDWWKCDEEYSIRMNKARNDRDLKWIQVFSNGLLLGLLTERWSELARVCAWVEADLLPEYTAGDYEDELVDLYKSLAAGLRPEPMPGLEEVEARILKSRKKRPKLLFHAWDAARNNNQALFNETFLKAIQHFESTFHPETVGQGATIDWIALHHSVVALAAWRKGMTLPELTPRQNAFLISRESLGLSAK